MNYIYTEVPESNSVNMVCSISSEDAIVFLELYKAFNILQSKTTLWLSVYKDYLELLDYLETLLSDDTTSLRLLHDPDVLGSITRLVNNFLSSSSMMLTILEQDFPSSKCKSEWNSKRNGLHKDNIEYQLCYELRNYSQHYYLPINAIGKLFDENSKPYIFIGFCLPNKQNKLCKKINKILLNTEETVDIGSYIKKYMEILSVLFVDYMSYFNNIMRFCDNQLIRTMLSYGIGRLSGFMVCNQVHNGTYEDIVCKSTYVNVSSFYWVKKNLEIARKIAT